MKFELEDEISEMIILGETLNVQNGNLGVVLGMPPVAMKIIIWLAEAMQAGEKVGNKNHCCRYKSVRFAHNIDLEKRALTLEISLSLKLTSNENLNH